MSKFSIFELFLKISSDRLKRERDELLPLLIESKKRRRSCAAEEEEEEEKKKKKKAAKMTKKGGGARGFLQVAPPPPLQHLFLDLNEEPNAMWEEMKAAGKPTMVFKRMLTDSDVRRDLARCILNRQEMLEVLVPALTEEETELLFDKERKLRVAVVVMVEGRSQQKKRYEMNVAWWRSMRQFALVNGWTEFVHDNSLLKNDIIQLSYFRYGDDGQGRSQQQQQQQQLGLLIHCRPPQPHQDQDTTTV